MSTCEHIIDVDPIASSSSQKASQYSRAKRTANPNAGSYGNAGNTSSRYAHAYDFASFSQRYAPGNAQPGQQSGAASVSSSKVLTGFAQMAAGAGLVMLGVPMLILPGPGLLTVLGGLALAASGARKVFG
ncbi:MAG: hypothetical protein IJH04_01935 [Eggerthellaceae bacterium]|nr:hypothetical protein [Eggerthellaceae bacterium]